MNKEVIFGHSGGFPMTQDTLNISQLESQSLTNISKMVHKQQRHDFLIVDGCELSAGVLSPGIVSVKGELLPFAGGVISEYVKCYMNKTGTANPVADTATGGYNS